MLNLDFGDSFSVGYVVFKWASSLLVMIQLNGWFKMIHLKDFYMYLMWSLQQSEQAVICVLNT